MWHVSGSMSPSASGTDWWVHSAPIAYTSSLMRTTATRVPSIVNSCAPTSGSSSSRHTVTSGIGDPLVVELLADAGTHRGHEARLGEAAHHLVEEAGDDQPVG